MGSMSAVAISSTQELPASQPVWMVILDSLVALLTWKDALKSVKMDVGGQCVMIPGITKMPGSPASKPIFPGKVVDKLLIKYIPVPVCSHLLTQTSCQALHSCRSGRVV